jgi:hypothetical protein
MLRKAVLEELPAIRDAVDGPLHDYLSSSPERFEHVEWEEYKGPAAVAGLDDCIELEFLAHGKIIPLAFRRLGLRRG